MRTSRHRRRSYRLGHLAELASALTLTLKGYRILARRYRSPVGEIDLVCRRGNSLAFVEVKARDDRGHAAKAVSPKQQARIARAASHFLARHPHLESCNARFDVILVTPWRLPQHVADAWRP
ncbi:MAG: YraN family protein [Alphaproteobacteria bacterium]